MYVRMYVLLSVVVVSGKHTRPRTEDRKRGRMVGQKGGRRGVEGGRDRRLSHASLTTSSLPARPARLHRLAMCMAPLADDVIQDASGHSKQHYADCIAAE